jgi:urease accessory protein
VRLIPICMTLSAALVAPVLAHTAWQHTNSFATGIAHPLIGMDHILAMVAVGVWGAIAGGRALWVWPLAFVATMLAGFATATWGLQIPFVEPAIAASIIVLGLSIALALKAPVWLGAAIAGLFAFFHGHSHGTEAAAAAANLLPYACGFALATAGLHAAGVGVGLLAANSIGRLSLRAMGGGIAVLGGVALIGG